MNKKIIVKLKGLFQQSLKPLLKNLENLMVMMD